MNLTRAQQHQVDKNFYALAKLLDNLCDSSFSQQIAVIQSGRLLMSNECRETLSEALTKMGQMIGAMQRELDTEAPLSQDEIEQRLAAVGIAAQQSK